MDVRYPTTAQALFHNIKTYHVEQGLRVGLQCLSERMDVEVTYPTTVQALFQPWAVQEL